MATLPVWPTSPRHHDSHQMAGSSGMASAGLHCLQAHGCLGCTGGSTWLPYMFVVLVVVIIAVYVIAHTLLNQGCQNMGIFDWPQACR